MSPKVWKHQNTPIFSPNLFKSFYNHYLLLPNLKIGFKPKIHKKKQLYQHF
jgi:hypothetical protein